MFSDILSLVGYRLPRNKGYSHPNSCNGCPRDFYFLLMSIFNIISFSLLHNFLPHILVIIHPTLYQKDIHELSSQITESSNNFRPSIVIFITPPSEVSHGET